MIKDGEWSMIGKHLRRHFLWFVCWLNPTKWQKLLSDCHILGRWRAHHGPWLNNNVEGNNFIDYDSIERNFIDQISRLAKINNNALAQRAPSGKRRRGTQYTHCRRDLQNYFFIIFFEEFPNIHVSMFLCYRSNWLFSDILIDLDLWICML